MIRRDLRYYPHDLIIEGLPQKTFSVATVIILVILRHCAARSVVSFIAHLTTHFFPLGGPTIIRLDFLVRTRICIHRRRMATHLFVSLHGVLSSSGVFVGPHFVFRASRQSYRASQSM